MLYTLQIYNLTRLSRKPIIKPINDGWFEFIIYGQNLDSLKMLDLVMLNKIRFFFIYVNQMGFSYVFDA